MLINYLPILLMLAVGFLIGFGGMKASEILGPSRPNKAKNGTYESGVDPVGTARERFSVKFYLVAMLFIVFDIEVVFMYPWAVQVQALGLFAFVEMILFVVILLVGYFYVLKKGALEWD